jgi:hypothetical protein
MKYIIVESKLDQVITDYLDELFPLDNVHETSPYEYDEGTGEESEDNTRIEFYLGDYGDEETIFRWYGCEYFYPDSPTQNLCPKVVIEHPYDNKLTAIFNDRWEEPFKKWFTENFDLPIKSVEWKRLY